MVKIDMDAIRRLSVPERVRLVQDIWDSLEPTARALPLTEEQQALIDRRLDDHRRDPESAVSWEELQTRLESR
jgi:putative addiction module component (TIGR02574 family)